MNRRGGALLCIILLAKELSPHSGAQSRLPLGPFGQKCRVLRSFSQAQGAVNSPINTPLDLDPRLPCTPM